MPVRKRIICLANSRKLQGRCVAGRELIEGSPAGWIRPVSDRIEEELSATERRYDAHAEPEILDVIDISFLERRPKNHQQENWLIDTEVRWEKIETYAWSDIEYLVEDGPLWSNHGSTYHGVNDFVPAVSAISIQYSLKFVAVPRVDISVFAPGRDFGNPKRRVQASFSHDGIDYALWVTDPLIESRYLSDGDGRYILPECYLTISLGEPFQEKCSKLVAGVIEKT